MADEFIAFRNDVLLFFSALRQAIDRPGRIRVRTSELEREQLTQMILKVEEARIRFNIYTRPTNDPEEIDFKFLKGQILSFIGDFINGDGISPEIYDRRFRISPIPGRKPSEYLYPFLDMIENHTVADALIGFRAYILEARINLSPSQGSLTFKELDSIVPRQQVAPVQFDVLDGKIVVKEQVPRTEEVDRKNIKSALEHIRGAGDELMGALNNSNCDRRLLENVSVLHKEITNDGNIVKIGLMNMGSNNMCTQFERELPNAIKGMFNAYNQAISSYVAQFPEWDQFAQKAAMIDLDEEDIADVGAAAQELVLSLTENPSLSDPDVPKSIAFVAEFLAMPGKSSKRAAFAVIRTVENLVSSILRYGVIVTKRAADKAVDGVAIVGATALTGLLVIALNGASGIGPAALRAGSPWVKQAADIIQKQLAEKPN